MRTYRVSRSAGFTLVELMLVLAIATVLAVAAFWVSNKLSTNIHVNQEVSRVQQISTGLGQAYANSRSAGGAAAAGWPPIDTTAAITNGAIDAKLQNPDGSKVSLPNSVGGVVTLQGLPAWGTNGAVAINYPSIPSRYCTQLVSQAANLFPVVDVNGTPVKDSLTSPATALDPGSIAQQCATGPTGSPAVSFFYTLPGADANVAATTPSLGPNNGGTMPAYSALAPSVTPLTADAIASASPATAYNYNAPCPGGRDPTNPEACATPGSHSPLGTPTSTPVLASLGGGTPPTISLPPVACAPSDPTCSGGPSGNPNPPPPPSAPTASCLSQEAGWDTTGAFGGTPANPRCVKLIDDAFVTDNTRAFVKRGTWNVSNGTWNTSCGCYYGGTIGKYQSVTYGGAPVEPLIPLPNSCPYLANGQPDVANSGATYAFCNPPPSGTWQVVCSQTQLSSGTTSDSCATKGYESYPFYSASTVNPGDPCPGLTGDFAWGYTSYPGMNINYTRNGLVCQ